jgi:hypothetical protein
MNLLQIEYHFFVDTSGCAPFDAIRIGMRSEEIENCVAEDKVLPKNHFAWKSKNDAPSESNANLPSRQAEMK